MRKDRQHFYIGGSWVKPSTDRRIEVISPNTGEVIGSVPEGVEADIDLAVARAQKALREPHGWSCWSREDRAAALERLAAELDRRSDDMAHTVSWQNGVPIAFTGLTEGGYPQIVLRYYAGLIRTLAQEEERPGVLGRPVRVQKVPVGVVGAIIPWNAPQGLGAMKYAPALAAGCTIVLKPSPETVFDAYLLAEAAEAANLPPGVVNIVPGGREAGAHLVAHPGTDKIAFTGSPEAGRIVGETCGRLLKPVTLELGGKSAAIILDDADLDLAKIGEDLFRATLLNNGQVCYLGTRILAPRSRYAEVVDLFTTLASSLKVGDSLDETTRLGPLVSARQRDRVEGYIAQGKIGGARVTTGGGRPEGLDAGWFVEATVFADVDNRDVIAREEIFGPVLSIIGYGDDDDAIAIANDSEFGLGGTVWTSDRDRGIAVARRVQSGNVGINYFMPDPAAPFGGIKASGLGKELGPEGLDAYFKTKSIFL